MPREFTKYQRSAGEESLVSGTRGPLGCGGSPAFPRVIASLDLRSPFTGLAPNCHLTQEAPNVSRCFSGRGLEEEMRPFKLDNPCLGQQL